MHVSKEFLMEAVSLSLLVALILISIQMFERANKITALLEEGQEKQIMELEEYEIVRYDGFQIDGMTAIGYIKTVVGTYQLPVIVTTKTNTFVVKERNEYSSLRDPNSEKYIYPLSLYLCEVIRDENESIKEIESVSDLYADRQTR